MRERCTSYSTAREAGCFLDEGHSGACLYSTRSVYEQPGWQGPMWNGCGACNFIRRTHEGDRVYCSQCIEEMDVALGCLASNLEVAGALAQSFWLGWFGRSQMPTAHDHPESVALPMWTPGCGRPAS